MLLYWFLILLNNLIGLIVGAYTLMPILAVLFLSYPMSKKTAKLYGTKRKPFKSFFSIIIFWSIPLAVAILIYKYFFPLKFTAFLGGLVFAFIGIIFKIIRGDSDLRKDAFEISINKDE